VIVSYRDKRTREFATGKRVKAFSGFERSARLKLDRMEAATSMSDLAALPGNRFEALVVTARASTASALTINGGFASSGLTERRGHQTWRLSTITRSVAMALTAIHPGEHLAEELEALDMSAAELARKIDVPTNRVTQILNGTRGITGDTALRLAHFFGTSAQFWLNLQSLYDLRVAQVKIGKSIKALPTLKRRELVHA
jgi:addiction module HigA family antidote